MFIINFKHLAASKLKILSIFLTLFLLPNVFFSIGPDSTIIGQLANFAAGNYTSNSIYSISSWIVYIFLILFGTLSVILIGYLIGKVIGQPFLVGWAKEEVLQMFVSLLIFLTFAGVYVFVNTILLPSIYDQINLRPPNDKPAVMFWADKYIDSNMDATKSTISTIINKAMSKGQSAYMRTGMSWIPFIDPFPMLQLAYSGTIWGESVIWVGLYRVLMGPATMILSSFMAQKIFLDIISQRLGPFMVVLGLLFRSFFGTRKLGGLLLAAGIGVTLIFPLTYTLNWVTYQFAQGYKGISAENNEGCPSICKQIPPLFYTLDDQGNYIVFKNSSNVIDYLKKNKYIHDDDEKYYKERAFLIGGLTDMKRHSDNISYSNLSITYTSKTTTIYSCAYPVNIGKDYKRDEVGMCPNACRVLPYPIYNRECNTPSIRYACSLVPKACLKTLNFSVDAIPNSKIREEYNREIIKTCPKNCKIQVPLKQDCSKSCLKQPSHCRVVYSNGHPLSTDSDCKTDMFKVCAHNVSQSSQNCLYILPNDSIVRQNI